MPSINLVNFTFPIVGKDGKPTQAFYLAVQSLVEQQTFDGSGSPEGVLAAKEKAKYWDRDTDDMYFKTTPEGNTGWVLT